MAKALKTFILNILTLQLIIGVPAFAQLDGGIQAEKDNCTGASKVWDDELNSCITNQDAIDIKDQTNACADSENPDQCYMDQAQSKTGVQKGDSFQNKKIENVAQFIAGIYSVFTMINLSALADRKLKYSGNRCTSKKIFQITSAGWVAGDLFLKHLAKKNFEKLSKDYKSEQENKENKGGEDSSFQAQTRAFAYLREEQEQVKDQAKKRKVLQIAVIGGYAAALGFAIKETFWPNPANVCKGEGSESEMSGEGSLMAQTGLSYGQLLVKLGSSPQMMVAAGVMLTLNGYLIHYASQEQSRAEENIKSIDDIIDTYSDYMAGFCPDGREDLNNERCYCYQEDGNKNENRTNSAICQNLFAADDLNYSLLQERVATAKAGPRQGCMTVTGQFDVDCKCRNMINNVTKQNACAKTPATGIMTGGFGASIGAPNAINTGNSLSNGASTALAKLDEGALQASAARQKKVLESLKQQSIKNGANLPKDSDIERLANEQAIKFNQDPAAQRLFNSNGIGGNSGSRPPELASAIKKAEEKADFKKASTNLATIGTGKAAIGPGGKNGAFKFNWDDNNGASNKVQNFMKKKYDYKDNDIVKRDDVSLWNVISNRYQTSGLRRLFGEDDE